MKIREKRTIIKNEKKEVIPSLSTLHFNLRTPKSLNPTQLYAILYIRYKEGGAKQFKIPLQCKLLPFNWNQKRETVIFNGTENEITVSHLNDVLTIINNVRLFFLKNIYMFATNSIEINELINIIKNKISNKMNERNLKVNRGITASTVVKNAFKKMYESGTKKASTVQKQRYKLNSFLDYLKSGKVRDSARHRLTTKGIIEYRNYIHEKNPKMSDSQSYKHIQFIISLINHAVFNSTKDIGISQIQTEGLNRTDVIRDKKRDNKHVEIKEDELQALKSLSLSSKRERDARDLFLFGCTIGCRYSDLYHISKRKFQIKETDEGKVLVYETQKGQSKHITAYVPFSVDPIVEETISRISGYDFNIPNSSSSYNKVLKKIFKQANLHRPITYKDVRGTQYTEDLCDIVASHDMRVTGATRLLRKGVDNEFVVRACGWADDTMIREIYGRLTADDEAILQLKRLKEITRSETTKKDNNEEADLRNALIFLGADSVALCDITSKIDLYVMLKKYEGVLLEKGVDYRTVKEIYNENISMKERIEKLKIACAEALQTT